jgi:hypothetical protein
MLKPKSDPPGRAEPLAVVGDEAVLRATGVFVLLGIGAIHFLQLVDTFKTHRAAPADRPHRQAQ